MPAPASPQRTIDLIGLGIVLSLLGDATLYTVLPDPGIAAAAGISLSVVGVVLGLNRLVRLAFNPAAGVLYDRLPLWRLRGWLVATPPRRRQRRSAVGPRPPPPGPSPGVRPCRPLSPSSPFAW